MEFAQVEVGAQRRFGQFPQLTDFEFAHLVSERLARPRNVAVDFRTNVMFRQSRVGLHEFDRLGTSPPQVVHAGIHDQPARTPHLECQPSEVTVGILVEPDFET